ncbi:MAG TPA: cbb3-type cytochrome c oxidase subunit I [Gammaproteobacteria bacterium]|nr:cbb3-type cytochrome c oxidase subunit I [Gammaproteobacteria bacterium]
MSESAVAARLLQLWETPRSLRGSLATVDHKTIGLRYLVTSLVFLVLGGIEALVMRVQLAASELTVLDPERYDQLFTMHGITMIFWYAAPILSGFSNYLMPLMLGARDMALPRLNAFTYWSFLLSGVFIYAGLFIGQAPHAGWFAYAPYTLREFSSGPGMDFYALGLIFLTISTTAGGINFLVTIFRLRAPGMRLSRMPLLMYSTGTTSVLIVLALPALTAACLMLLLDRQWGTHFFDPALGGTPLLWQQLFWFFGHPWVYIIFLPATGMISVMLPVYARRPLAGYTWVATATVLTGLFGLAVWVHHMFATGMSTRTMSFFSAASIGISVMSTIQVAAWIATLWRGKPVMTTALRFILGFIALFVIGGLSGVVTAYIPFDWQLTDTYFIVAHIHYVILGANVFPVFAAFYHWLPKMTGRLMNEKAGRWGFWLMFVGFNAAFFPMHLVGLAGMPRRIYTYPGDMGWDSWNLIITFGAYLFALGVAVNVVNFLVSARHGARAPADPWGADTLEWSVSSPPPAFGSVHIPKVSSRNPRWDEYAEEDDPKGERILDQGRLTLATHWRFASPQAVARMPEDTAAPLVLALLLTALFTAALLRRPDWTAGFLVLALACTAYWLWPQKLPVAAGAGADTLIRELGWDEKRGTQAMAWLIVTEALLFVSLFFAYFLLADNNAKWPMDAPPALGLALAMLGVLLSSGVCVEVARHFVKRGRSGMARIAIGAAVILGLGFLALQSLEYRDRLKAVLPTSDAYGSIFYTITSIHGLHVAVGLLMLTYVACLPRPGPGADRPPHRPLHAAALYWHFVDAVWIVIVFLLYLLPRWQGA